MKQVIIEGKSSYEKIGGILRDFGSKKYMLVYTGSAQRLPVWEYLMSLEIPVVLFNGFTPNPKYEEVVAGVDLFNAEKCDAI